MQTEYCATHHGAANTSAGESRLATEWIRERPAIKAQACCDALQTYGFRNWTSLAGAAMKNDQAQMENRNPL
jgi:hypothetical protein